MKKRFTGIILAVMVLTMSVLTGCSLITTNWDKYYNAVVSTIVDKDNNQINITKRDLITAYASYGYYYEQYYGYSKQAAIEQTLTQLESRKLMISAAEKKFSVQNANGEVLTDKEKTYLWQQTNTALQDNFMSYVDQVSGSSSSSSDESDGLTRFTPYKHNGVLAPDYKVEKTKAASELLADFEYNDTHKKDATQQEYKMLIYNNLVAMVDSVSGSLYSKAFTEYRKALQKSEEGLTFKQNRIVDLFLREIDRLYNINYENYLIEKYTEQYRDKSTDSDVTVNAMLELYINKVLNSYNQYVVENDSNYESDVLSNLSSINYFKNGQYDTKFYTVSHILFKFSDAQSAKYNQAKSDLNNGKITQEEYDTIISELAVTPIVRNATRADENGVVYEEVADKDKQVYERDMYDLYDQIKVTINGISDPIAKAEKFNEYIYMYNEDPGIMNAQYNYVMGVNKYQVESASDSEKIELADGRKYKSYSQMVPEFTLAGAELYNDGKGEIGDLSGLVMTEHGFHILMYTGECKNYFDSIVEQFVRGEEVLLGEGAIDELNSDNARLNVCVDKKIFDVLYDELAKDNFSTFQSEVALMLREDCKFKHFENEYKDLFAD